MKIINIVINEQHSLLEDQKKCLDELVESMRESGVDSILNWIKVPAEGWSIEEMDEVFRQILQNNEDQASPADVVFVSPVPYLIMRVAESDHAVCRIFHNDRREKKELPNGKVIYAIAKEGWELV